MEPLNLLIPENSALQPVDPALANVKRIAHAAPLLVITIAAVVAAVMWSPWMWLGVLACVLYFAYIYWLIGRRVRAHRYLEGDNDFIVASGRWWRSITVIPYGRIQLIDIDEGPLLRLFGLATLKLNTASASSDAAVHGLPREEALALRTRLSQRAHDRMAGL
ncbi:PH domain-containing protein [uncultured Corynebacterium sp.]|uniref:PH domain-containing protein n=1 Tax=uncultured Corynebacterium sp. TaxID=159447 RepID=UPI002597B7BD|nr:PH domain-containing protein [uncultured Corynebacterium sp.]